MDILIIPLLVILTPICIWALKKIIQTTSNPRGNKIEDIFSGCHSWKPLKTKIVLKTKDRKPRMVLFDSLVPKDPNHIIVVKTFTGYEGIRKTREFVHVNEIIKVIEP